MVPVWVDKNPSEQHPIERTSHEKSSPGASCIRCRITKSSCGRRYALSPNHYNYNGEQAMEHDLYNVNRCPKGQHVTDDGSTWWYDDDRKAKTTCHRCRCVVTDDDFNSSAE